MLLSNNRKYNDPTSFTDHSTPTGRYRDAHSIDAHPAAVGGRNVAHVGLVPFIESKPSKEINFPLSPGEG